MEFLSTCFTTAVNQIATSTKSFKNFKKLCFTFYALVHDTLYQADIRSEKYKKKIYYGISETKFKTRYLNHKKSFNHDKPKNDMQLSNELWKIKAPKEEPVLVWKILGQYQPYNVNTKRCLLCLNEKLEIANYRGNNMLNKWTEIISKCRHRNKYTLASYDSMD